MGGLKTAGIDIYRHGHTSGASQTAKSNAQRELLGKSNPSPTVPTQSEGAKCDKSERACSTLPTNPQQN